MLRLAMILGSLSLLMTSACLEEPADVGTATSAITNGELDGNAHLAVVLILMEENGEPAFRCSGTLIAPDIVLTAGHCTGAPGEFSGMRVFTESDVDGGNNDYPYAGPNSVEATAWRTHPAYTTAEFFLHDVGVIKLAKKIKLPAAAYGKLPAVDQLESLAVANTTRFTAVGYGLQQVNAAFSTGVRVRMRATPQLLQINTGFTGPGSLLLSNNAATGGTCFGDSGGPNFLGTSNVVAGVTSFGLNGSCGGTGGVFRADRADVQAFVAAATADMQ